jgi:hypothetical protein
MSITLKDFQPINNNWKPNLDGEKYDCCKDHKGQPKVPCIGWGYKSKRCFLIKRLRPGPMVST